MLERLAAIALLVPLLAVVPAGPASSSHYLPQAGDSFTFTETTTVSGGYGNYSGYSEQNTTTGTVTVTIVRSDGTENATYNYSSLYVNSLGADQSWHGKGNFTFSASTYDYVVGTDAQAANYDGSEVWFYTNSSDTVGSTLAPLLTSMTVRSLDTSFPLDTAAGTNVRTIYACGNGAYVRDDSYGLFNATYDWNAYFDPATGYIVAYEYNELDSNGHGDGFVYTNMLWVTKTTYALTQAPPAPTYAVTFAESGLPGGTTWAVTFDGVTESGTGNPMGVGEFENGTYLFGARLAGYTVSPGIGLVSVNGGTASVLLSYTAASSGSSSSGSLVLYIVVAVIVVLVVVVIAVVAARLARRSRRLPRHPVGGQVQYGPPPFGPAPPPVSLQPAGQPQIQQVVVKEVVKVNCRYCGSLIDSTAEKCPFCGATRA